ncbi:hypothetical protein UGMREWDR_CDS0212 [Aeromonas phage GomatiRiver_11]|nr:hypothetical protein OBDJBBDK_00210 [Aeromonas phage AhFM11]WKW84379.1 hypothetical protein UGMREWDR_CDS0212 [Aeromonas phage GomatiRiver_11]
MDTLSLYICVIYLSTCTVLAINVLKWYTHEFRWNFVWTTGQKVTVVLTTIFLLLYYSIPRLRGHNRS